MKIKSNSEYDVIILGGGPAGCAAAIAAGRQHAKVLLIEQAFFLGGMGTGGLVPCFTSLNDGEKIIYGGITLEIIKKSNAATYGEDYRNCTDWPLIDSEKLKVVYEQLVLESGADIIFNSRICDAETKKEMITGIYVANKSGITEYKAKAFVDCTGDADVAAFAGVPFSKGSSDGSLQVASLCFKISNINTNNLPEIYGGSEDSITKRMMKSDKYSHIKSDHLVVCKTGDGTMVFNAGHIENSDATDPMQVSRSMIEGRLAAFEIFEALKEYYPENFGNSELVETAPLLGSRESRRIEGEYCLTIDDYKNRRTFKDEIARNAYYIDCHQTCSEIKRGETIESVHYQKGESHGIPFRCLVPKTIDNLLVAGRSISCDRMVQSSIRVMCNCLAMGEAAGTAAALAGCENKTMRQLDIDKVRKILRDNGSYFCL